MKPKPFVHPETRHGEVFFSNTNAQGLKELSFRSKRAGTVAYDGGGKRLQFEDWFPVFVRRDELRRKKTTVEAARKLFNKDR